MLSRIFLIASLLVPITARWAPGAEPALPAGGKVPLLRIDGKGPTSSVTGLAFSPDGNTLYAAGYDKEVRVWTFDDRAQDFRLDRAGYRVLIGPGLPGAINAIAVSPDGGRLAIGGLGVFRGGLAFEGQGIAFPPSALTDQRREDQGLIYVYQTGPRGNRPPPVRLLRGHRGPVLALAFVPGKKDILVSVAREGDSNNRYEAVVRVWDVRTGESIASLSRGLPRENKKPALAAWATGADRKQVRVALAWDDGVVRLWDVGRGDGVANALKTGPNNKTVAQVPGALFTTSFQARPGRQGIYDGILQQWRVAVDSEELPRRGGTKTFPPVRDTASGMTSYYLPVALAPLSSRANGKPDLLAVLVQVATKGQKDQLLLQLVELDEEGSPGKTAADVPLWQIETGDDLPVLATAGRGRFLAVAGSKEHVIRAFSVASLLRGKKQSWQLESQGANLNVVSFLARGKDLGLKLRESAEKGASGAALVFDFSGRKLETNLAGWRPFGPDTDEWKVERRLIRAEDDRTLVEWTITHRGERAGSPLRLDPAVQQVTSWALLPAMKPWNVPLLALAYLDAESGEAVLCLYNGATGQRVRQFEGHVGPVRSLAFSADGRLLASAAEDQTISLWSLTTLGEVLDRHGLVPGLVVARDGKALVVRKVAPDSPAHGKLAPGDRIDGIVLKDDKLQQLATPLEFYEAVWQMKPGAVLTLRVQNKGPIRLQVGQGVDERNALLSLFVLRGQRGKERQWIAWSPLGFYDASNQRVEQFLLWHFNKGAPDEPTSTAPAGQFRKEYQKPGILKFLIVSADPSEAFVQWKNAQARRQRPLMLLWIAEVGPDPDKRDGQGRVPVTQRRATLVLELNGFPFEEGDAVAWQFENGPEQSFEKRADGTWTADLAGAPWKRGLNRVRAILKVEGDEPRRFAEDIDLHFQPPPPLVTYKGDSRRVVHAEKFALQATVLPAPGEQVLVTLSHTHDNKELLPEKDRSAGLHIEQPLTLRPGLNRIEIVARNQGATAETAAAETVREVLEVFLPEPRKADPPLVALVVEDLTSGKKTPVKPGARVVVSGPRIRLTGTIEAKEPLTAAEWTRDGKERTQLTGFVANRTKTFAINETLALDVKPHVLVFFARAAGSDDAQVAVRIVYQPLLPRLVLTSPADELVVFAGERPSVVTVGGDLTWPADVQPCTAEVLVNGKPVKQITIDRATRTLSLPVELAPGDNQIRVRLKNGWGRETTTDRVVARFLRRPRIVFVDASPVKTTKPLVSLTARVTSPVPVQSARAVVQGSAGRRSVQVKPPSRAARDPVDQWTVQLVDVALDPGRNEVSLWVNNTEAGVKEPATLTVDYSRPREQPRPPVVELVFPAQGAKVSQPEITFKARIQSTAPLQRVELLRDGQPGLRIPVEVAKLSRNPQGFFEVAIRVPMKPRENLLRLEAVNAGGSRQSDPVLVNYVPQPPVRVVIKHLLVGGTLAPLLPMAERPDGTLVFAKAAQDRVSVVGEVSWDPESDALLRKDHRLDISVNGLRQLPVDLDPARGTLRQRTFKAEVSLTRAEGNRIKIELPAELKRSVDNQPVCVVDCTRPVQRQRVYLLVIGVGEQEERGLLGKVFKALQATEVDYEGRRFRTPAFFEGRLYGPLTGYVTPRKVLTLLSRIRIDMQAQKRIDLRRDAEAPADVLLLYFQGRDGVRDGSYVLRTSDKEGTVNRAQLLDIFQHTLGAQVLFLDVVRETTETGGEARERWPEDSGVSVLRLAWLDPAVGGKRPFVLAQVLVQALSRAYSLKEVAQEVTTDLARMAELRQKLLFYPFIPPELAGLPLGVRK